MKNTPELWLEAADLSCCVLTTRLQADSSLLPVSPVSALTLLVSSSSLPLREDVEVHLF